MSLQAIIIRADGALANTEDIRRRAFAQVFSEAEFSWSCDREGFALTAKLGSSDARMAHYVRSLSKERPETEDFALLVQAMHRRALKVFLEMLTREEVAPRPGIRELVAEAKADGLQVVLITRLRTVEAEALVKSVFGARGGDFIDRILAKAEGATIEDLATLYEEARSPGEATPQEAIVIEATKSGASAARSAGFPVLNTRSHASQDALSFEDGFLVVEDLLGLLPGRERFRATSLTEDDRADLLAAIKSLHATGCQNLGSLDWSDSMRVSDILKTKGSDIKSIHPKATMRAVAHALKTEAVGALLVRDETGGVQGIITERDVVRGLDQLGDDLSRIRVSDMMTRSVVTCAPEDSVATVANVMTQRRIRHLPVVSEGRLVGLVSIGDVLKHRLDEVELEANVLREVARIRR
jgi:CBS domain-containing protein/beta-phosphoglucomutase-like phosphatase (HAD superfamily)